MKYKVWDKQSVLVTPIGEVLTREDVLAKYPMAGIEGFDFLIHDAPISLAVFMEVQQAKNAYKKMIIDTAITPTMTEQEVDKVKADYDDLTSDDFANVLTFWEDNQPDPEPTTEERIASALEFQNILLMPEGGTV